MEDLEMLNELENRMDINAARESLREGKAIPWDDVKQELKEGAKGSRMGRKSDSLTSSTSSRSTVKRKRQ